MAPDTSRTIFEPGRNCWQVARAHRASLIVDAGDYYHVIREAMAKAQRRILVIGWDFDTRISLEPLEQGEQENLGGFFLRLIRSAKSLEIYVLKWSFGAKKQFLKPRAAWLLWKWYRTRQIDFKFDAAHPPGCSHHQKIVVIDDSMAICGGIDIAANRWDTTRHHDEEKGRVNPDGKAYGPWHDLTFAMQGPVAQVLGDLGRDRWGIAGGGELVKVSGAKADCWPEDLAIDFTDVDIAISRTRAAWQDVAEVREIEELWLDMIGAARLMVYIENQYLTSAKIAAAIAKRMEEPDPPEIVMVMPRKADGWLEQRAMDAARVQLARMVGKVDRLDRFRIYVPVTEQGTDIYVHAKIAIVDDRILRVGSANLNNRSFGLDSECDVTIDTALPANTGKEGQIAALRTRLISEHLDVAADAVTGKLAETGSLIATIESLRGEGKTLELLDLEKPGPFDCFIADNELLDPEHPDKFLEPISQRGLRKTWAEGLRKVRGTGWRRRDRT